MGPRVYNLFPTLAGPMARWTEHFDRIAAMGFNWVYVNPIHVPGGSGSLYAVADYYRLNPLLRGSDERTDAEIVRDMVGAARERGLAIMLDLVVNHTANDSPLVDAHPSWYVRGDSGEVVAPSAVDPDDPEKVTVWGDLAELDYGSEPARSELIAYFSEVVRHYVQLGVRGFRCDAAYKVPPAAWTAIIAAARAFRRDTLFAAETLGCTVEEVAALGGAGFDYLFNSSKWWDFQAPWLLEQYDAFRRVAPSIAFPESHDTPRLAGEFGAQPAADIEAEYRFRYLFAAFFSSGVMLPMGYEYGFTRKLDVVTTRPSDWEAPRFDLTSYVAGVNAMKAASPALNDEGPERLLGAGAGAIALLREDAASGDLALALINHQSARAVEVDPSRLRAALGGAPRDVTPDDRAEAPSDTETIRLGPHDMRVFRRDGDATNAVNGTAPPSAVLRPVVIENVTPLVDGGRYALKRVAGERVTVEADVFREGHGAISAFLSYRKAGDSEWRETPLAPLGNDRWRGAFVPPGIGTYEYAVEGRPDAFASWRGDAAATRAAGQALGLGLTEGRALVAAALARARGEAATKLASLLDEIDRAADDDVRADLLLRDELASAVAGAPDRTNSTRSEPAFRVAVERSAAGFSAWYELFVRSQGTTPAVHGTFADAERRLPDIAAMGFDVVYLAPIHPIGHAFRKGRNNALDLGPGDPGSPWAIGNADGGHTAVEPALGTLADFERFVAAANARGLEVALDYALQCSPDHPFVADHPEWFSFRADGSIRYAENPPKKYQDIVNFNWEGADARALWEALRDVVLFWIGRGVRIFRVDNPHTKPFAFWEWMIADVRARHPDTIFLAEAFTRPKVMYELAKRGFSQSYTYFTWRNTKDELTAYVEELAHGAPADFYRPHFWPNTPDILPPILQTGGRPAFRMRLVLAATLSSLYGIYSGYELCENAALPGREEYADSEKYEIKVRDWNAAGNIKDEIATVNRIRRENPALHDWRNVRFYRADDPEVIFYGKRAGDNVILVAVNLDPFAARDALLWLPTGELGIADDEAYDVEELLSRTSHRWTGSAHHWRLDPRTNPAAIFRLGLPA
jgi:starch synthase (maltosyl-transferring)